MGIEHIGAGKNIVEASKPVVKTINGKSVSFLAFCDWRDETVGWCPFATENEAGVNPMYDDYAIDEIKKYKKQSDFVVVMPHWGKENTWVTTQHVFLLSQKMMNAGADLIIGSHPHRVQPVVNYKHASVAYSMGNFLFPDRLITKPRSTYYPKKKIDFSTLPVTDGYPYVDGITYKKWKPLARIGMVVVSQLEENKIVSTYELTMMGEDGKLAILKDKNNIERILKIREKLLRVKLYPFLFLIERYGHAVLKKLRLYS
jgi:poly-gamma-glutamate synthesis protein (capsule biosynthesis protein)